MPISRRLDGARKRQCTIPNDILMSFLCALTRAAIFEYGVLEGLSIHNLGFEVGLHPLCHASSCDPPVEVSAGHDITCLVTHRVDRSWRDQDQPIMGGPFAMLLRMGTLEDTKHKPWTWILGAPLVTLKEAGVHFDPDVRGLKAIQGDAQSGSALEVRDVALLHVSL